jgi:hypothetical protein
LARALIARPAAAGSASWTCKESNGLEPNRNERGMRALPIFLGAAALVAVVYAIADPRRVKVTIVDRAASPRRFAPALFFAERNAGLDAGGL